MRLSLLILALLLALYFIAAVTLNRSQRPADRPLDVKDPGTAPAAGATLRLLTWNLGYAGLGADGEFVADGGNRVLPPSRASVDRNMAGIVAEVARHRVDVAAFQEVTTGSPLNYWRQLRGGLDEVLSDTRRTWLADVETYLLPWPLALSHGLATYARPAVAEARSVALPIEQHAWLGILRKQYAMLVTRLPIGDTGREWVVANIHLAAFDEGGQTRREQLAAVFAFGEAEYRRGHLVVLVGDWNMELVPTHFPHATSAADTAWLHPLPPGAVPAGWTVAADATRPSVRTLQMPYRTGVNATAVIDGFIVSPNVAVTAIETIDLDFAASDHNPVLAELRAR